MANEKANGNSWCHHHRPAPNTSSGHSAGERSVCAGVHNSKPDHDDLALNFRFVAPEMGRFSPLTAPAHAAFSRRLA